MDKNGNIAAGNAIKFIGNTAVKKIAPGAAQIGGTPEAVEEEITLTSWKYVTVSSTVTATG